MSQNLRRRDVGVEYLFDVGAANSARGHLNQDFPFPHFRYGHFLDAHDSFFAVDARAHGLRDRPESLVCFQCCSRPAQVVETSSILVERSFRHCLSTAGMYWSRKSASDPAAARHCRPNRSSKGSRCGRNANSFNKPPTFTFPRESVIRSKSRGKSSSAASEMARTPTAGTLYCPATARMWHVSISTKLPVAINECFSSAVVAMVSDVRKAFATRAPQAAAKLIKRPSLSTF